MPKERNAETDECTKICDKIAISMRDWLCKFDKDKFKPYFEAVKLSCKQWIREQEMHHFKDS